jgi:copper homeostasis protein
MATVEIVCCSVADARAAERGGAHRIELCAALEVGGLTPSLGLLQEVKARVSLPVMAMVRPRPGGFHYDMDELATMERDARLLLEHGADGIVFGPLNADATVNADAARIFMEAAAGRQTVFHRAFDATPDPFAALETLIALGVTRILTSGQHPTAAEGTDCLRGLRERAAGRIEILPGGGIRAHNVRALLDCTGCTQVHLAPLTPRTDPTSQRRPELGYGSYRTIDGEAVAEVVRRVGRDLSAPVPEEAADER